MTLKNKRILITRPYEQASYISELIRDHDGEGIQFPTIEIRPLDKSDDIKGFFNKINKYDFVFFISRNSVQITFDSFLSSINLLSDTKLVAIGSGTAEALIHKDLTNVIYPKYFSNSEAVLDLEEIQQDKINKKKILIIRGVGGRELLAENLKVRGAKVDYVEIYERCLPKYSENEIDELWDKKRLDAIIVTSNEILANLIKLLKHDKKKLFSIPLVTMSERIAEEARKRGFIAMINVAKEKNDDGILASLIELIGG